MYAIFSVINSSLKDLSYLTWDKNKKLYAEAHNYKAFLFDDYSSNFDRFKYALSILDSNPEIMWLWYTDCDSVITNFDVKIEDRIIQSSNVILSTDSNGVNTGSILLKNSEDTRRFLHAILALEFASQGKWDSDQWAINHLCSWPDTGSSSYPTGENLIVPPWWYNTITIVPQKHMNSYNYQLYPYVHKPVDKLNSVGSWEDGDWLLHLPGLDLDHRVAIISTIVDKQQKIQLQKDNNNMMPVISLIASDRTEVRIELDPELQHFWQNGANYTDHTLNEINNVRFYDQLLSTHAKMRVLDIGANIGLFALYMHSHAEKIIALEPSPDTFSVLQKLTAPYSNIQCLPLALGYTCGNAEFYVNQQNTQMNGFMYKTDQKIVVPAVDLPTLIEQSAWDRVDLVKCDIEGGEIDALTFSKVNAVKDKVYTWFVEVHAVATAHKSWEDVINAKRN